MINKILEKEKYIVNNFLLSYYNNYLNSRVNFLDLNMKLNLSHYRKRVTRRKFIYI